MRTRNGILILLFTVLIGQTFSQHYKSRKELNFPNILGYSTLLGDFHIHTVHSDGEVLPRTRMEEAWRDGLDVIAITEHLEYKNDDVKGDHNSSYEEALKSAEIRGILLVKATEITKSLPPGHFNALFTKDNNKIYNEDWRKSLKEAADQGAFIIWNHPGWTQPDIFPVWYKEHEEIFKNGWMHGIEVVNEIEYYPLAIDWCLDKNLTMFGNSDIHQPVDMFFKSGTVNHRPMTLVFAKDKTLDAVKEALFKGRTVVYDKNRLIGKEEFISEIFNKSIELVTEKLIYDKWNRSYVQIRNKSSVPFICKLSSYNEDIKLQKEVILYPDSVTKFLITDKRKDKKSVIKLGVKVENLIISSKKELETEIKIN